MNEHPQHRFFVESLPPVGAEAELPSGEAHHAVHVLRLKAGAAVELFDGAGGTAVGRITSIRRNEVRVLVECLQPPQPRPGPIIHLLFAVPKGKRLDWLLEKATELGAATIQPVVFQRSVAGRGESETRTDRWLTHCLAAAKQCGLNFLPQIRQPVDLASALKLYPQALRLFGDPSATKLGTDPVFHHRENAGLLGSPKVCLLIGPEGGLTEEERAKAVQEGFLPVCLGATTLRVETAAIALLAACLALLPAA